MSPNDTRGSATDTTEPAAPIDRLRSTLLEVAERLVAPPERLRSALLEAVDRLAATALRRLPEATSTPLVKAGLGLALGLAPLGFALTSRARLTRADRKIDDSLAVAFPAFDRAERVRIASQISTHQAMAALVRRVRDQRGDAWLEALVTPRDATAFMALRRTRRPTIVVSWHAGSSAGLITGLARLEREAAAAAPDASAPTTPVSSPPPLIVRFGPGRTPPGWAQVVADRDPVARGKALQVALKTLRAGGLVVLVLDAARLRAEPPHPNIPFLGRMVRTSPGPAWLARLSGATVVPALAVWRGSPSPHVDLAFGPAIGHPDVHATDPDLAHTRAIYAWFEAAVRADPSTLWPKSLINLAHCPAAD